MVVLLIINYTITFLFQFYRTLLERVVITPFVLIFKNYLIFV